jgi:hypothetical protein
METVMSDTTGDALALTTETVPPSTALEHTTDASRPARATNGQLLPGYSGNPRGRPMGARSKCKLAVEEKLGEQAEALSDKLVELALEGNVAALRLCIERLAPRLRTRGQVTPLELPEVNKPADLPAAFSAVVQAAACGDITSEEAKDLADVLEMKRKSFETIELEQRMEILEKIASRDRRAL